MVQVIHKIKEDVERYSLERFCQEIDVTYIEHLEFQDHLLSKKVQKQITRALKRGYISLEQKWLGAFYAQEIQKGYVADLTIYWIDELQGYGVMANQNLPAFAYIGEYVGEVRRKDKKNDWKNDYCFDYAISDKDSKFLIDAKLKGNATRFINHSDRPNLEVFSAFFNGLVHILLRTKQPIVKGAQLTYDYGQDYWRARDKVKIDSIST